MALIVITALTMLALLGATSAKVLQFFVAVYSDNIESFTQLMKSGKCAELKDNMYMLGKMGLTLKNSTNDTHYPSKWVLLRKREPADYQNSLISEEIYAPLETNLTEIKFWVHAFCKQGNSTELHLTGCSSQLQMRSELVKSQSMTCSKNQNVTVRILVKKTNRSSTKEFRTGCHYSNCNCKLCESNDGPVKKKYQLDLRIHSVKTVGNSESLDVTLLTTVATLCDGQMPTVAMLKLNKTGDLNVNEELIHGDENLMYYYAKLLHICKGHFFELQMTLKDNSNTQEVSTILPIPIAVKAATTFGALSWTSFQFAIRGFSAKSEINVIMFYRMVYHDLALNPFVAQKETNPVIDVNNCEQNYQGPQCKYNLECRNCLGCKMVLNGPNLIYKRVCDCRREICETLTLKNVNQTFKKAPCDCKLNEQDGKSYGYYAVFANLLPWKGKNRVEHFNMSNVSFCVDGLCKGHALFDVKNKIYEVKHSSLEQNKNFTLEFEITKTNPTSDVDVNGADATSSLVMLHFNALLTYNATVGAVDFEVRVVLKCASGFMGTSCLEKCQEFDCSDQACDITDTEVMKNCWPIAVKECQLSRCAPNEDTDEKYNEEYEVESENSAETTPGQPLKDYDSHLDPENVDECDKEADESANGCKNGGECERNPISLRTECVCNADFYGLQCSMQCSAYCLNGAKCEKMGSSKVKCLCTPFYTGKHCELKWQQKPSRKSSFLPYILFALLTVVVSLGLLCVIINIARCRSKEQTSTEAGTVYVPIFAMAEKPYTTLRAVGMKTVLKKPSRDQRRSGALNNSKLGGFGASKASRSTTTLGSQQLSRKVTFPNLSARKSEELSQ